MVFQEGHKNYCPENMWKEGHIPWNKGLTKEDPRVMKYTKAKIGKPRPDMIGNKICLGIRPPNYKDGRSMTFYDNPELKRIRKNIQKRDNWTCFDCKKHGGSIDVHHIDENKSNLQYDNLITLCKSCHTKRHRVKKGDD